MAIQIELLRDRKFEVSKMPLSRPKHLSLLDVGIKSRSSEHGIFIKISF